ncbi:TPA: replication protein [Legionella pneumophila]
MSVLRIHKKQNNFVILDKTCLSDAKLSWGAKGLHAFLISLPDDWQVLVNDLQKRSSNGRDAVRAFLKELEMAGYIKKAARRNEETGRFCGMEYLVLETPESDLILSSPGTENPSSGNPSPGNPILLNNKELNNKTAAENNTNLFGNQKKEKNDAATFSQRDVNQPKGSTSAPNNKIQYLSQDDALIGDVLTEKQLKRVQGFISKLALQDTEQLCEEICYCLLNKTQFTGCGNDFSKKLNAIRAVILRGDWQTPAEMIKKVNGDSASKRTQLEQKLREAHAEFMHFNRLLSIAKDGAKVSLHEFMQNAKQKIRDIELLINQEVCTTTIRPI